ncbi:polysaccharide deacetylase family protein [Parageobacillus thermoglucosidasius]|uniref:polysaccharide deacetylase family protein n=1 Tax=Parageobacillus thermoglucosidasius TaxID=1426 RepID=UPI0002E33794|nr:polysaccharide deacetylase family protein [Parageobacillus thermoglucosidasius]KYD18225.1 Polysaccharide deacetylase, possible chitooligosaccharide deacetylase [Anoxybacillus flavithermus]OAO88888.1 Polysaccharide deacetylase possible chitooligosaccharide deacetylase [Parageobacillus thermoglucosidasius]GMN98890.1 polysaccharide deacetylase family protein [Parageobacillus thermoglucosidasius]
MVKKRIALYGIISLTLLLFLFGTYKLMNARTYQLFGGLTSHVETNQKAVALTFDDGPTKNVEKILPLLDKYHAKATFFVTGKELKKNPKLGKKIAESGHQIGNHTYSHQRMIFKKPSFIKQEIEMTNQLIRKTGYKGEIDFRPPYGKKLIGLPYYLKKHHIETITWSLEPDTYYSSVLDKVNYVNKHVKPGAIILLHPMYDNTGNELKTIEGILDSLSKKGYQFVTVNKLQKLHHQ